MAVAAANGMTLALQNTGPQFHLFFANHADRRGDCRQDPPFRRSGGGRPLAAVMADKRTIAKSRQTSNNKSVAGASTIADQPGLR